MVLGICNMEFVSDGFRVWKVEKSAVGLSRLIRHEMMQAKRDKTSIGVGGEARVSMPPDCTPIIATSNALLVARVDMVTVLLNDSQEPTSIFMFGSTQILLIFYLQLVWDAINLDCRTDT